MLLAIEQGNTNSLFAVHDGGDWIAQWRSATEPSRTADEYAVWLSQLMAVLLAAKNFTDPAGGCRVAHHNGVTAHRVASAKACGSTSRPCRS